MKRVIRRVVAVWLAFRDPGIVDRDEEDELTKALSRRPFRRLAEVELARAQRGQPMSIVYIDIDGLKIINDTKGHTAGDIYLREFAQIILANIRPYDLFARWGGDEFVLLLSGADSVRADKIICRMHALFPHFSWGISSWSAGDDLEVLLKRADSEMYRMKKNRPGL